MVAEATLDFTDLPVAKVTKRARLLTDRWVPLRYHETQWQFRHSTNRFNICPSGRRSGKTEIGKRRLCKKAFKGKSGWYYVAAAPTRDQAKRIFWTDLKKLVPVELVATISEQQLTITLTNGAIIAVMGMDRPERVEGIKIAYILMDEYANMKQSTWGEHVRPALSDPEFPGEADFIGVPEGRTHYWEMWQDARERGWGKFHWFSSAILSAAEIDEARAELDSRTFQQEYEGAFVTYAGLAYYAWSDENIRTYTYNPDWPLVLCFDFNREPGIAIVGQEHEGISSFFDEIYIPTNSNTPMVCRELLRRYESHKGRFRIYGDASGGAKGADSVRGSNWDLVRECFEDKDTSFNIHNANPPQIRRINAMNGRLCNAKQERRLFVDPRCKYTIRDFEGVGLAPGTNELDKSEDLLTHQTDAIGYYAEREWPGIIKTTAVEQI